MEQPVEMIYETLVEIIIENSVYIEKFYVYEKPVINRIIREVENVIHKEVPVYRYETKNVDRIIYQPHETSVITAIDQVYADNHITQDRHVDVVVEVVLPQVQQAPQIIEVEREVIIERESSICS